MQDGDLTPALTETNLDKEARMAEYASTTRRSILKVASIIDASLLTTAIADALEMPLDRVNRLSEELSDALNNYANGRFHAVIYPSHRAKWPIAFMSNQGTNYKIE